MDTNDSLQFRWVGLVVAAVLGLSGCSPSAMMDVVFGRERVPEDPGLYAEVSLDDGAPSWQRLDGPKQWEIDTWAQRSDLDPGVAFVIRHPELAQAGRPLDEVIQLRRVAWVRSTINERGEILPAEGGRWATPDLDVFVVPLRVQMIEGRDDTVRAVPVTPLEPGLYSLELGVGGEPTRARVGVRWPSVDERTYSAATCVDRYAGAGPRYRPCAEQEHQTQVAAAQWLRLYLVPPEVLDAAQGRTLVVKGVVVNASEDQRTTVPPLEAQVRGAGGEVLQRWHFDSGVESLEPGGSASFRTEARNAPPGTQSVHVQFAPL